MSLIRGLSTDVKPLSGIEFGARFYETDTGSMYEFRKNGIGVNGWIVLAQVFAESSLTAENTFTSPVRILGHGTVRISGTFVAEVVLQRSEDAGVTWHDTGDSWTSPKIVPFTDHTRNLYRAGVKTGSFTSGQVDVRVGSAD